MLSETRWHSQTQCTIGISLAMHATTLRAVSYELEFIVKSSSSQVVLLIWRDYIKLVYRGIVLAGGGT